MDKEFNEKLQTVFFLNEPPWTIQSKRGGHSGWQDQSYLKHNVFYISDSPMIYKPIV